MVKLYNIEECMENLNEIMDLIYEEWGQYFRTSKEDKIVKIKKAIDNKEDFPKAYVLKDNNELIGTFTIKEHDLDGSDLSPWLACVLIKKHLRGKGYGRYLLEHIKKTIDENYSNIYLTTKLNNFYEKIGFQFVELVNHNGEIDKLYSYKG